MNIFLQIDRSKRPKFVDENAKRSDKIIQVLESLATKTKTYPEIEADWLSFHSIIKVRTDLKVDERTLSSRDLYQEITQMNLKAKSGQIATGGTKLHDQKDTNFQNNS